MYLESDKMEGMLSNLNKKGLAAFFRKDKGTQVLMREYLLYPDEFEKYPEELKNRRNNLIYLIGWQILASIFAMFYIFLRRSYIYFFVNIISIGLAIIGLTGILQMRAIYLIVHCLFTTSITGGFFFFQIIDFFMVSDTTYGQEKRLGDDLLLIIFSLPYLYDAFTGLMNFYFLYRISIYTKEKYGNRINEESEMKEIENIEDQEIKDHLNNEKLCILCCTNVKDAVLNPCGHLLCCVECAKAIMKKKSFISFPTCPICRVEMAGYIKLREA